MYGEKELLELSLRSDIDFFIQNDSYLATSIMNLATNGSPFAFKICFLFSRLNVGGQLILNCQELACSLIEEVLPSEVFMIEALKTMESLTGDELLDNPIWFLLARSKVAEHKKFQNLLFRHFPKNPSLFSEIMEKTGLSVFIPTLEEHLKAYVPYVKYLPLCEDSHELFPPHDVWLRVGASYARLVKKEDTYPEDGPSVLEFLEMRFYVFIPDDKDQWLQGISEGEQKQWQKFEELYWEQFEYA